MMSKLIVPVVLQLLGVLVVIAEIVIPSAGLLAILAAGLIGYSIYLVFTEISSSAGMAFIVVDIIAFPAVLMIGLKLLVKSPVTLKTSLSKADGFSSQPEALSFFNGKAGAAVTDLRPAGTAMIENKRVDVVSRGEYIEKGAGIVVLNIEGNRVVVKKK
ncbi:MAG: serine protease [Desulfobacterales bacterium]|jgi:membrane-bound serine protease (ClpP class)|nr:serine protease [Desulfobacterales bacterium]